MIHDITTIEQQYYTLLTESSLRYFETICEVYGFDKASINLTFNIREWARDIINTIYQTKRKTRNVDLFIS